MCRTAIATVLALAGSALGQYEITVQVDDPVLRPGESTTVTLLAGFGGTDYAMAGVATDFITSVGSTGWSEAMVLTPMDGPGTSDGVPSGSGYDMIIALQINGLGGITGDPTNPIAFWRATYTAPTDVPAAFDVDLLTETVVYDVYIDRVIAASESRLSELVEGASTITVIPAPASALVLAGGLLTARRRRRIRLYRGLSR